MSLKKILAILIALIMTVPFIPAYAYQDDVSPISIEFIDITDGYEKGVPALDGESKILVRAYGLEGDAIIAQTAVLFSGNLKYRGIQYLAGENKYPQCVLYYPDAALVNFTQKLTPSIITNSEYTVPFEAEGTDLFILTFYGEPGESVELMLSLADTYYVLGDDEVVPDEASSGMGVASESQIERKTASIKLTMDKVTTFAQTSSSGYADTGIELSVTDEENNYTLKTVLNNILIGDGGHRDGTKLVPTFEVKMDVTEGKTYSVKVSGMGYVSYEKKGITFDTTLELTNSDFKPGDVNGDGSVDEADKEICTQAITDTTVSERYAWATDINRDGDVNDNDLLVFDFLSDNKENTDDGKDEGKEDVKEDGKEDNKEDSKEEDAESGNNDNKDDDDDKKGSGSSGGKGGGGGGGGGGGFSPAPSIPQVQPQIQANRSFTDLSDFSWAEDAIYTLKDKGVINGTTQTTFSPAENIKRGDFILILSRMIDFGQEDSENFSDVPSESYYASAISKAKKAGIAKGSGNEFYPENSITRQDLITLAYRAFLNAGYINEATDFSSLEQFADKSAVSDYALAPLASMVSAGIIKGSNGLVNPNGNATRAEVAVMCERLLKLK